MDSLCGRLETLTSQLSRSLEAMHQSPRAGSIASPSEDLTRAAQVLNSLPNIQESVAGTSLDGNMHPTRAGAPLRGRQSHVNDEVHGLSASEDSDTSDDEHRRNAEEREDQHLGQAGALVRDPHGRLR